MKYHFKSIVFLVVILIISSCAGSKKIDFDTAYKFSSYNYQNSIKREDSVLNNDASVKESQLYVSTEQKSVKKLNVDLAEIEEKVYGKIGISAEEANAMEISELKSKFKELDRKEQREIRKEIKTEVRELNKEIKETNATLDVNRVNEISDLTRWSIIIGSVGLVLLILGAIFSGILTFFGALFVVGAAVLFIIDQAG